MKANRFLNILYVLLIFAALFGIFKLKQVSKKNVAKIISQNESKKVAAPQKKDALLEIIEKGLAAKCTFSQDSINSKIAGEVYIDGELTRADITAPDKKGANKLSHSIIKGDVVYLWYDKNFSGMKLKVDETTVAALESNETTPSANASRIAALQNIAGLLDTFNYKCEEWAPDSFKFVLPPDVSFIDANEFVSELDRRLCQKCEQEASEASRLLCRRELKCK